MNAKQEGRLLAALEHIEKRLEDIHIALDRIFRYRVPTDKMPPPQKRKRALSDRTGTKSSRERR